MDIRLENEFQLKGIIRVRCQPPNWQNAGGRERTWQYLPQQQRIHKRQERTETRRAQSQSNALHGRPSRAFALEQLGLMQESRRTLFSKMPYRLRP